MNPNTTPIVGGGTIVITALVVLSISSSVTAVADALSEMSS